MDELRFFRSRLLSTDEERFSKGTKKSEVEKEKKGDEGEGEGEEEMFFRPSWIRKWGDWAQNREFEVLSGDIFYLI